MVGTAEARKARPSRQCVVSRRREPRSALLRLQLGPDDRPYVDLLGRADGRGVYIAPEELRMALTPKGLQRVFRGKARPLGAEEAEALVAGTVDRMTDRIGELLGLARRAGCLALGMEAVLRRIEANEAGAGGLLVVVAEDVAPRSVERVVNALHGHSEIVLIRASTRARIGGALGREAVGVAAVWHSGIRNRLETEAARLTALCDSLGVEGSTDETRKKD